MDAHSFGLFQMNMGRSFVGRREEWYAYFTGRELSKPHLFERWDDDGSAVFACGCRVTPEPHGIVVLPDGTTRRTAQSKLSPVETREAHGTVENGRAPGCGVCLYEARKRQEEMYARELASMFRFRTTFAEPSSVLKFTGLT